MWVVVFLIAIFFILVKIGKNNRTVKIKQTPKTTNKERILSVEQEQEQELRFNFILKFHNRVKTLESEAFKSMDIANDKTDYEKSLFYLKDALDKFEKIRIFCYSKGEGGKIYFDDMWLHCHNSKNQDFSYIDKIKNEYQDLLNNRDKYTKKFKENGLIKEKSLTLESEIINLIKETPDILQKDIVNKYEVYMKRTVGTYLNRLEKKGSIERVQIGNSYRINLKNNLPVNFDNFINESKRTDIEVYDFNTFKIPSDIFEMLWVNDGKFKNYISKDKEVVNGISISTSEEPSLIFSNLKIARTLKISPLDKLGYFPSYKNLTPEQRYVYFKWLENPYKNTNIDIGYIFLFYYGLERHLISGKQNEAFEMIIRLIENYKHNSSFYSYATEAIMIYLIHNEEVSKLNEFIHKNKEISNSSLGIFAKSKLGIGLYADDIISVSSIVGFTNKRYIKSNYELFLNTLNDKMLDTFNSTFLNISNIENEQCSSVDISGVANYSLKKGETKIPNILSIEKLKNQILDLLKETHEEVKLKLKEQRKDNKVST